MSARRQFGLGGRAPRAGAAHNLKNDPYPPPLPRAQPTLEAFLSRLKQQARSGARVVLMSEDAIALADVALAAARMLGPLHATTTPLDEFNDLEAAVARLRAAPRGFKSDDSGQT